MKNKLIALCLIVAAGAHAVEQSSDELNRIETLSRALQNGGVTGLLSIAQSNGWACPRMPSKWHVENRCKSDEWRKVLNEARGLGLAVAIALDGEAADFQTLPVGEKLNRRTSALCDLSEWCSATTGHGNILLAQRSLDIAAVGLARLIADLDWPLEASERLSFRMTPDWMSVKSRAAVFNDEAGASLFSGHEPPEELEKMFATGKYMLDVSRGWKAPFGWRTAQPSRYADKQLFGNNLDFFEFTERDRSVPYTVTEQWNFQAYRRIYLGMELQAVDKALALVGFRNVVGTFPETPEEFHPTEEQKKSIMREAELNRNLGAKTSRRDQSPYYNPMQEAFKQAWRKQPNLPTARYNEYGNAFQAYDEVKRGCFLDYDTMNAEEFKKLQERREEIRRQMEERSRARTAVTNAPVRP